MRTVFYNGRGKPFGVVTLGRPDGVCVPDEGAESILQPGLAWGNDRLMPVLGENRKLLTYADGERFLRRLPEVVYASRIYAEFKPDK